MLTSKQHTDLVRQRKWWFTGKAFRRLRTKGYEKFRSYRVCLLPSVSLWLSNNP